MPYLTVSPVLDETVRDLCTRPYPRHPKGCPHYGRRETCPPWAPIFDVVYDLSRPVIAVWNVFDLTAHVERMRTKHQDWSRAQLVNCLYWQGSARKLLGREIALVLAWRRDLRTETCPEAMGVNVTATMASIGVELEWPPVSIAVQVALLACPKGAR